MTHEPTPSERIRDAVHDAMDGDRSFEASGAQDLSSEERRKLADEQLLHALLQHQYAETPQTAARRVERVIDAISARPRRSLWARALPAVFSSAAAILLVVILLQWFGAPPAAAVSEFDRVVAAFLAQGDRTYVVCVTTDEAPAPLGPPGRRGRQEGAGGGRMAGLRRLMDGGKLYFRDGNQYVFEIEFAGRKIWTGRDGVESWSVRPRGPVMVSDDPDAFLLPFSDDMTAIALLDVQDTLQAARQGYRVEPAESGPLSDEGPLLRHFVAHRISQTDRRPATIELWVDPDSGLLRRMICSGMGMPGGRQTHLTMDYENSDPLPANWFHYAGHATAGASVKQVTRKEVEEMRRGFRRRPDPAPVFQPADRPARE